MPFHTCIEKRIWQENKIRVGSVKRENMFFILPLGIALSLFFGSKLICVYYCFFFLFYITWLKLLSEVMIIFIKKLISSLVIHLFSGQLDCEVCEPKTINKLSSWLVCQTQSEKGVYEVFSTNLISIHQIPSNHPYINPNSSIKPISIKTPSFNLL